MYKIEFSNDVTVDPVKYYLKQKPTKEEELGACAEYIEYLSKVKEIWQRTFENITIHENKIIVQIGLREGKIFYYIEKIPTRQYIELLPSPRPPKAFLTSKNPEIRKLVKRNPR